MADQLALGYFRNFQNNTYEFSVEAFYKQAQDVTEFADHPNIFFNKHLATEFRQGDSESYDLELFVCKVKGRRQVLPVIPCPRQQWISRELMQMKYFRPITIVATALTSIWLMF